MASRIRKLSISLVCLLETRVKKPNMQVIYSKQFAGWNIYDNYNYAVNGRIWMLWKDEVNVEVINCTDQSISSIIEMQNRKFLFTVVYGSNDSKERKKLWHHLEDVHRSFRDMPWLMAGDFNVSIHPDESSNHCEGQAVTMDMQEFIDCRNNMEVFDHGAIGPLFTWTNKQQEGFLAKKLDRVLINDQWNFTSIVEFLAPEISDHSPAFIQIKGKNKQPPKPFKFFNFWVKQKEFLKVVETSWNMPAQGNPMKVLYCKLKRLKPELKKLNKTHFDDMYEK
ncbi:hypothetical protein DITRI_Ditri04bG0102500 [Diplodiscus trichospermus]